MPSFPKNETEKATYLPYESTVQRASWAEISDGAIRHAHRALIGRFQKNTSGITPWNLSKSAGRKNNVGSWTTLLGNFEPYLLGDIQGTSTTGDPAVEQVLKIGGHLKKKASLVEKRVRTVSW